MLPLTPWSLGSPDTHTPGDGEEILFLYPRSFCCPQAPESLGQGTVRPQGRVGEGVCSVPSLLPPAPARSPGAQGAGCGAGSSAPTGLV